MLATPRVSPAQEWRVHLELFSCSGGGSIAHVYFFVLGSSMHSYRMSACSS